MERVLEACAELASFSGELPVLRLAGLDLAASRGLLQERTGTEVSPSVAAQLLASTGGNPLALVEMPQALSSDQLAGRASLPGQLPVTATLALWAASSPPATSTVAPGATGLP